ncbi:uncharacterized protein LOC130590883 isoform X1 [Beta vulgaris subsp. vulgaris]|uniref:uncharacterized protein LOC130590883 isoform X1 n=1 Tax=Beta vulgaris subsp. vulgaris TaxID=3555 RepID=UPI00090178E5|nr:uncharacterized protein LOC130590883 isoform X1 [Beta vulgaris subsp. vulgaris]
MVNPKSSSSSFHPALAVSNIKNNIPILLEMENVQYATWAELFKVHARSHRVLHHIIAPKEPSAAPSSDTDKDLWATLDATVLQWIYSTISTDLLHTIIEPDATAMATWNRLRDIFQDNQNSRAVALEQEFSHLSMEDFVSASAYCQRLKELSDQLKNVGSPVSNDRLVLQLVSGLTPAYNTVGTLIRQTSPLPPFYQARSMLTLEEAGFAKQTATTTTAAMVATSSDEPPTPYNSGKKTSNRAPQSGQKNGGKNSGGRRGGGGGGRGSGGGHGGRRGGGHYPSQQAAGGWQQQWGGYPWQWAWPPYPPCPFPTAAPWARPTVPRPPAVHPGPGVLGPSPQAHVAAAGQPTPTDIEAAMYTLGLTPPDGNWYLDTGATSHMTSGQGLSDGDASHEV